MGKKIITSLNEFIMTRPVTEPTPTPSPTTRPETPVKPLPPTRPDDDKIERPSKDPRPLARRKNLGVSKDLNGDAIEEIGQELGKKLIKRVSALKSLPQ